MLKVSHIADQAFSAKAFEQALLLQLTAQEQVANRRYVLSEEPTPGVDYDDRLTLRLGYQRTKCLEFLRSGKLAGCSERGKWVVAESAVRRFLDPAGAGLAAAIASVLNIHDAIVEAADVEISHMKVA
jgi:hypothetical protein